MIIKQENRFKLSIKILKKSDLIYNYAPFAIFKIIEGKAGNRHGKRQLRRTAFCNNPNYRLIISTSTKSKHKQKITLIKIKLD
jgi:hypothetical protein